MRDSLKLIGLTEEEINTYLILLQEKNAKATTIAKKLGVARSSAYNWLDNLILKGLSTQTIINNIKTYNATKPALIPALLEERVDRFKQIIPKLEQLTKSNIEENTSVSLFKGNEGIKSVMNDILLINKPYTCFGEIEKYFLELDIFTNNWMRKAEDKKIMGRLIASKKQKILIGKNEECRFLPKNKISNITTVTYGSKTALFVWSKIPSIIVIEDLTITKREIDLFENYWKEAKNIKSH